MDQIHNVVVMVGYFSSSGFCKMIPTANDSDSSTSTAFPRKYPDDDEYLLLGLELVSTPRSTAAAPAAEREMDSSCIIFTSNFGGKCSIRKHKQRTVVKTGKRGPSYIATSENGDYNRCVY
jgi:hypothetical protein